MKEYITYGFVINNVRECIAIIDPEQVEFVA